MLISRAWRPWRARDHFYYSGFGGLSLSLEPGGLGALNHYNYGGFGGLARVFLEPGGSGASVLMVKHVQKHNNCKPFLSFFAQGLRKGPAADRPGSRILTINPSL